MNKKTVLSWEDIQQDCKKLADKLSEEKIKCIVGIANGGMIPATLLAKHLKVNKLLSANLKSYVEDKPRFGEHSNITVEEVLPALRIGRHSNTDVVQLISFPFEGDLTKDGVLIIDDLVDTGLTLKHIQHNFPKNNWIFATLYYKSRSIVEPDYTVREFDNDDWIVFPWET